jgi:hypothetical protein
MATPSLPPLHDIADMAGLDLPQFLGQMKPEAAPAAPPVGEGSDSRPKPK